MSDAIQKVSCSPTSCRSVHELVKLTADQKMLNWPEYKGCHCSWPSSLVLNKTDRQTDRQTDRRTDAQGLPGRQADRQTDRQTDGQTDRQHDKATQTQTQMAERQDQEGLTWPE